MWVFWLADQDGGDGGGDDDDDGGGDGGGRSEHGDEDDDDDDDDGDDDGPSPCRVIAERNRRASPLDLDHRGCPVPIWQLLVVVKTRYSYR